jgi:hypothetical protein
MQQSLEELVKSVFFAQEGTLRNNPVAGELEYI